jgi:hypothetical protein
MLLMLILYHILQKLQAFFRRAKEKPLYFSAFYDKIGII